MIHDSAPLTNQFISVPPNLGETAAMYETRAGDAGTSDYSFVYCLLTPGQLNCAAFIAGIIKGVLDGAEFVSCPTLVMCFCLE